MPYIYYIPILLLFVVRIIYYLVRNLDRSVALTNWRRANQAKANTYQRKDGAMEGLRNAALTMTQEQLGIQLPVDKTIVYGVVMDLGMDGGVASIVSYQTGDASLYLNTGGGILGGGNHENVNSAAKQFTSLAKEYLNKTTKTETTELPDNGVVKFYLLTNNGIYVGQGEIKNFENNSSPWTELFYKGNEVLTELRMANGK